MTQHTYATTNQQTRPMPGIPTAPDAIYHTPTVNIPNASRSLIDRAQQLARMLDLIYSKLVSFSPPQPVKESNAPAPAMSISDELMLAIRTLDGALKVTSQIGDAVHGETQ